MEEEEKTCEIKKHNHVNKFKLNTKLSRSGRKGIKQDMRKRKVSENEDIKGRWSYDEGEEGKGNRRGTRKKMGKGRKRE